MTPAWVSLALLTSQPQHSLGPLHLNELGLGDGEWAGHGESEAQRRQVAPQHFGMTTQASSVAPTAPWNFGKELSIFLLDKGKCMGKEGGEG